MLSAFQQLRTDQPCYRMVRLSASRGNTIAEYALIGILVVVVCIVGMQALGSGLNSAMAMVKQNMKNHQLQASAALMAQKSAASGFSGLPGQGTQLSAAQQALLQQSLAQKLQTTGANGATEVLADQLAATAALLLAQGKIDQTQYDILMKLANQGHRMAQIEGMVAQAVQMANGDPVAYENMTFNVDGQTYTAHQLTDMLGYMGPTPYYFANNSTLDPSLASSADPELATFLNLYNQAVSSGALSDPTALATVNSAASQIAALGEITESVSAAVDSGEATDLASVTALGASQASQMSSAQICTAGNFQDNGVLCTP